MRPLQFPTTPITPEEDPTEYAIQRVLEEADTFEAAIVAARSASRCHQLGDRLGVVINRLLQLQDAARQKEDAIAGGW